MAYWHFCLVSLCEIIDPPENTTVSNTTVDVIEGTSPPRITCNGNAYPPLQYQWFRNGTVKSEGPILHIYKAMTRDDAGTYECVSRNKHGTQKASIEINILCKFEVVFASICLLVLKMLIHILCTQLNQIVL